MRMGFKKHRGMSHPQWPEYLSHRGMTELNHKSDHVQHGVKAWLDRLAIDYSLNSFNSTRRSSKNVEILSTLNESTADLLLKNADFFHEQLSLSHLGHLVDPNKKVVIIGFPDVESMLDYVEFYGGKNQSYRMDVIGMHLRSPFYDHILIREDLDLDEILATLAHEFTHSLLFELELPKWIDEGLAVVFEKTFFPRNRGIDSDYINDSVETWSQRKNVKGFISGSSWGSLRSDLTYGLAERVVRFFLEDMSKEEFIHFLELASHQDGGRGAFRRYYEGSLDDYLLDIHRPEESGWGSFSLKVGNGGFIPGV